MWSVRVCIDSDVMIVFFPRNTELIGMFSDAFVFIVSTDANQQALLLAMLQEFGSYHSKEIVDCCWKSIQYKQFWFI